MKGIREHYEEQPYGDGQNRQSATTRPKEAMLIGLIFLSPRLLRLENTDALCAL